MTLRTLARGAALCAAAVGCVLAASCAASTASVTVPQACTTTMGAAQPAGDSLAASRLACKFGTGDTTQKTLGVTSPAISSVKHVIVLMMENRSFDHFLSDLPSVGVAADVANSSNAAPNFASAGNVVPRFPLSAYCPGGATVPSHEWSNAHLAWAAGRLDGFAQQGTCLSMGYYRSGQLPVLYTLAQTFALSERHFASLLGPTVPNRLFMFAATSCGLAEGIETNPAVTTYCAARVPNIVDSVRKAGHSVKFYDDSDGATVASELLVHKATDGIASVADFEADLQSGALPEVVYLDANSGLVQGPENDDHPPADVRLGEAFLSRVVGDLFASPVWASTVLFITYDEYGGFYDHVNPPAACDPDEADPKRDWPFDQLGFRVPLVIVSPFAKRGYVSKVDTDHTSMTRFIEHWLGLGALTPRDANAWPFLDAFQFDSPVLDRPALPSVDTSGPCSAGPACQ